MRQDVTGFFTMLQGDRARGGVGIRAPARGGMEIRAPARGGGDSGPGAGWGLFGVRWEIFYLFAVFSPFG